MTKEKFDQNKYIDEWKKKNKIKKWVVDLKEEEKKEIDYLIEKNGFKSNKEFILKCRNIMKSKNNIIKKDD